MPVKVINNYVGVYCPSENINPMLVFETRSGDLAVVRQGDGYVMDFPLNPPTQVEVSKTNTP